MDLASSGSVAISLIGLIKYISMALRIGGSVAFFVATSETVYLACPCAMPDKESANRNRGV
uniref:Uncharacterized protein n=1 Tax=Arundo donax TaxID=35708 RepID=A0A0A9GJF6_ARUDO